MSDTERRERAAHKYIVECKYPIASKAHIDGQLHGEAHGAAERDRLRLVVASLLKAYDEDTCCAAYGKMDLDDHLAGCPFLIARDAVDAARKEKP